MKRKAIGLLLVTFVLSMLVLVFVGCDALKDCCIHPIYRNGVCIFCKHECLHTDGWKGTKCVECKYGSKYTQGLEYTLLDNNTYAVSGHGDFYGKKLNLSPLYNGLPVTEIGDGAFNYIKRLDVVTIPDSVTTIGAEAFVDCYFLSSVEIGSNVATIGDRAFVGCDIETLKVDESNNFYKSVDDVIYTKDGTTLVRYAAGKDDTSFEIPTGVTIIGKYAFEDCNNLTAVTMPDSVITIEDDGFSNCVRLTSVTLSNCLTTIGDEAFSYSGLTNVTLPDSVTTIGNSAFYYNEFSSITIPKGVTSIGDGAFAHCEYLQSIVVDQNNNFYKAQDNVLYTKDGTTLVAYPTNKTDATFAIPSDVVAVAGYAFMDCENLTSVTIPNGVTSIGKSAFNSCSNLLSVTIPDSVTSIGERAFASCSKLQNATLGNGVTTIEDDAFVYCSSLTSIAIPHSVTAIGKEVFYCCDLLATIDVDEQNKFYKSVNGVLYTKDGTTLITYPKGKQDARFAIPNGVVVIDKNAFSACEYLSAVVIPDSVTTIGDFAFSSSGLIRVEMGSGVTSIGSCAFAWSYALTEITYNGTREQWKNVAKDSHWAYSASAYYVTCTNGKVRK